MAQTRIHEVEGLADGLTELFEKSSHNNQWPRYAKDGIRVGLMALDTFLDTCEAIMARLDRGSRSKADDEDGKPFMVMFPRRRRVQTDSAPKTVAQARSQTDTEAIMSTLISGMSIVGLTGLVTVAAIALEIAAFFGTAPWARENFSRAE